jgi:hypothetical protein
MFDMQYKSLRYEVRPSLTELVNHALTITGQCKRD